MTTRDAGATARSSSRWPWSTSVRTGCVICLQQEGRGIGIANKVAAYEDLVTVDANTHLGFPTDARQQDFVPSILSGWCRLQSPHDQQPPQNSSA